MPFKPYEWSEAEADSFLALLQQYYEKQEQQGDIDVQPIKYNALGLTLTKVIGEHQAFFLIQTILGTLIIFALLWFMLSSNF